jgi:hypothetical protein
MSNNTIIKNKAEFEITAQTFLDKVFNPALKNNLGDIEIRTFPKRQRRSNIFVKL